MNKRKNIEFFEKYNFIFTLLSIIIIIFLWWLLSVSGINKLDVVPAPWDTLKIIWLEMQKPRFFTAIRATLRRSLISFVYSFMLALVLALLAYMFGFIRKLVNPFIVIFRSMPTAALVLVLLFVFKSSVLPVAVGFLVVFPLIYENIYTGLLSVDKKLITMAEVFKVPKIRQITGIYLPASVPYLFSSLIAGFGLNIKVVIAAEVMGLPSMSIGYIIQIAQQGLNLSISFAWLVIAVIVSYLAESVLRIISRFFMPYKYNDLKILKSVWARVCNIFKKKQAGGEEVGK